MVIILEYPKLQVLNSPLPKKEYLKASIMPVIGFNSIHFLYFKGAELNGYITVVAYINRVIPNCNKNCKSLYLVVNDVIIIPKPRPNKAIKITKIGNKSNFYVIDVAQKQDGNWTVIELNDGSMSGLSCNDPELLYGNLLNTIEYNTKGQYNDR